MIEEIAVHDIKPSENNPRLIQTEKFKSLVQSVKAFPEMLKLRPIVVDEEGVILGGNMRYRACLDAGYTKVWIIRAESLTDEQKREFVIKDNVSHGTWDWESLDEEWETEFLEACGLDVPNLEEEVDYSVLEGEAGDRAEQEASHMQDTTTKAIQIEFDMEDYEEADKLIKEARTKGHNIGKAVLGAVKGLREEL